MSPIDRLTARSVSALARTRALFQCERTARRRYGAAVVATALALLGALAIDAFLHVHTNLLFLAAVAVSAWYGGRGPGLMASIVAGLAITFLHRWGPATAATGLGETVYVASFLFVALVVGATTEALRRARAQAEARAEELASLTLELEEQMEEVRTLSEHLQESNDSLSDALAAAERLASRAMMLQAVTAALSQARTKLDIAEVVLDRGLGVLEGTGGLLARVDGEALEMISARGYSPDIEALVLALSLADAAPLPLAVKTGEPVWLWSRAEYRARFPWAYERFDAASTMQMHVALPLRHGDEIVGALAMSFVATSALDAADQAFALLLAQAAADALARARTYDVERAARREAESLAQTRADVLGIVAHDLRNPLNAIGAATQVLLELDISSVERERMLGVTRRAVRRMNRLISDLLDATRLQAGRLTLDLSDVDVREIVWEVDEMCRHEAEERRVRLETVVPEREYWVRADEGRVLQAVGNLIGNALKFTSAGGRVTVSTQRSGEEVVFRVADTGPGIAAEHQAHLFDGFWQARDGDRRGVGLGLAITKGIVDSHGGRIWLESTLGAGSTFAFALPVEAGGDLRPSALDLTTGMEKRPSSPPDERDRPLPA
jgi:signal transduction histidine kinase